MGRRSRLDHGGRLGSPATQNDPDTALVERARRGDTSATEELYRRHARRAYNLAYRMLGNSWDAADVAQEAFIKAFTALPHFKGEARFTTWFHRIVVNAVYDHLRRSRPEPFAQEDLDRLSSQVGADRRATWAGGAQSAVEPAEDGLSPLVRRALLALNEGFRLTVVLCDLLGFDYADAAEILGVQEGTIKSRIFRARAQLARYLKENGYRPPESASAASPPGNPVLPGDVAPEAHYQG